MNGRRLAAIVLTAGLTGALVVPMAQAADPATSTLAVPSGVGSAEVTWTGTVNPGASGVATNSCDAVPGPDLDTHVTTIQVPANVTAATFDVAFTFDIQWADGTQDMVLSVIDADGNTLGSSDGGSPQETVSLRNLPSGDYSVIACAFAVAAPTAYDGLVRATVAPVDQLPAPEEDFGLQFSAGTVADIQRDEAEPLVHASLDGVIYTCGPTGSSQVNEYAQVSLDGGDQFHLMGEPPRGQISQGGGGDCAIDTGLEPNEQGNYQLAYTGLSSLTTFTTATSPDNGGTIESSPTSSSYPVVDRQWVALTDDLTAFHAYNKLLEGIYVQKSTDGGFSYDTDFLVSPGAARGPGDMTAMVGSLNPAGSDPVVYYPWQMANNVMLAISLDGGTTWNNCTVYASESNPGRLFPGADHDNQGNLYVVWTEAGGDDTYLTAIRNDDLTNCNGGVENDAKQFEVQPGFAEPQRVNRAPINSTVFPWIVAGGAPGRVAISYFGTPDREHPDLANSKTWHVYVAQTLNALDALDGGQMRFAQAQATTHPPHYDSICLNGLGCDLAVPAGDRSMADFFAMDMNPVTGELLVVFNRTHKRPGDAAGLVATPVVVRQVAGPSNLGGTVSRPDRTPLRNFSEDPTGDAIADYSSQFTPPTQAVIPAADITSVKVGPAVDPETGDPITEDAGFTVTATFDDLSDAALQAAMQDAQTLSLMYIFRFVDGFRYSAAVANWNAVQGFTFGFNEFAGAPNECVATEFAAPAGEDGCLKYPADMALEGHVDQEAGTITMTVPLSYLEALEPGDPVPSERAAKVGDRIYTSAMYVQSNKISPTPALQSWLEPIDNSPAFDFILGARTPDGSPGQDPEPDPGAPGGTDQPPTPITGGGLALLGLLTLGGAALAVRRTR